MGSLDRLEHNVYANVLHASPTSLSNPIIVNEKCVNAISRPVCGGIGFHFKTYIPIVFEVIATGVDAEDTNQTLSNQVACQQCIVVAL